MLKWFCIAICLFVNMSAFAQYGTTKHYEYADSSRTHNLKIHVDYPVKGNPAFLRRVRTFIMETLEYDSYSGAASMGRYNGDSSDGQAVLKYYGVGGVPILKKRRAAYEWESMNEERVIKRIAENDLFVSFEVTTIIWDTPYNAVVSCYGETFRKSDGKKLNIIANSQSPQFRKLLNDRFPEDMKGYLIDSETDIPIPNTKPYLIQSGVRFVYQKREVTAPDAQYIQEDIAFPEIQQFLTEDVKEVLGHSPNNNAQMDLQSAEPEFAGGYAALYEHLNRNLKYPVIAEENGIQGDVEIQFVVEKDGSITNVTVSKSVDPSLDKEAIRVVRSMPNWSPAKKNGVIVRSQQHLTIPFRLGGSYHESQTSSMQKTQAWFLFGSENELMEQGVLKDGQVLRGKFNKDYFTKIDTRIDKEINLYSHSARILTSHPANSFTLKPDENKLYVLRITDPQQFWSTSECLVILVE